MKKLSDAQKKALKQAAIAPLKRLWNSSAWSSNGIIFKDTTAEILIRAGLLERRRERPEGYNRTITFLYPTPAGHAALEVI